MVIMPDLLLADIIAIIHLGYVIYVILGFVLILLGIILRWKWIRNLFFRITHLLAIVGVACEALLGLSCPLTVLEYRLRQASSLSEKEVSFIGTIIDSFLFYNAPQCRPHSAQRAFPDGTCPSICQIPHGEKD